MFHLFQSNCYKVLVFPSLVFLTCVILSRTINFNQHSNFSLAILGDLIITAPLLYFFAIRKKNVSKIRVIRILFVGLFFSTIIPYNENLYILRSIKLWVSPLLECIVIGTIVAKFYTLKKGMSSTEKFDFLSHCRIILKKLSGSDKISNVISSEVAVFYYLFKRNSTFDNVSTFSVFKDSGVSLVLFAITGLFAIETAGMHLLLSIWDKTVAWTLTILSLYTCIQIIAHLKALKSRPSMLTEKFVVIRSGLLGGDVFISYNNILFVELAPNFSDNKTAIKIGLLKTFEKPTIAIHTKEPVHVIKGFGIKKITTTVLVPMDNSKAFYEKLSERLV